MPSDQNLGRLGLDHASSKSNARHPIYRPSAFGAGRALVSAVAVVAVSGVHGFGGGGGGGGVVGWFRPAL
jgi:hypothetical protein